MTQEKKQLEAADNLNKNALRLERILMPLTKQVDKYTANLRDVAVFTDTLAKLPDDVKDAIFDSVTKQFSKVGEVTADVVVGELKSEVSDLRHRIRLMKSEVEKSRSEWTETGRKIGAFKASFFLIGFATALVVLFFVLAAKQKFFA